jgi:flavodoxin
MTAAQTAAVVCRSSTGTTRSLALEIGHELTEMGVETTVASVGEIDPAELASVDVLLTGCWTNGWFVVHQHPDEPWLAFARDLPVLDHARVALFTTYKITVGGMFRRMRDRLRSRVRCVDLEIASRDGHLTASQREALARFVGAWSSG